MAMLLHHEIDNALHLQVGHPCFEVDAQLAEIPELSTVVYRVFPGFRNRQIKQQIAVSFAASELPTDRWPVDTMVSPKRIDDQILETAIFLAVDHLGGRTVGAKRLQPELERYGLKRRIGTLRYTGRGEQHLNRLVSESPRQARIARCLGFALAHSVDDAIHLPVEMVRAEPRTERAQIVLPMHRAGWQGTAHGCATG